MPGPAYDQAVLGANGWECDPTPNTGIAVPYPFTSRTLIAADNGNTLICATAQTATVNTGLPTGFGCAFKGEISFNGTATVTDVRVAGAVNPWCRLVQTGPDTYDVINSNALGNEVIAQTDPLTGGITGLVASGINFHDADLGHARGLRHAPYYNLMSGQIMDFPSASFVHVGGSGSSVDTSARNSYGGYTATLNVGSTLNNYARIRTYALDGSPPDMDIDGTPFVVVVEIESGMADADQVALVFATNPASNGLSYTWSLRTAYHIGDLYFLTASADLFTASGGLTWDQAMTYMHVQVTNKASSGGGGVVKLHGVFRRLQSRPKLIIDFDDNYATAYTQVFPYMAKYGLVGNIGVIADRVGTAGYMTEAQIDEMYAAGWDMVVHGDYAHTSGMLNSYAAILADIEHNRDYIAARWPRAADHYIFPAGQIHAQSESALIAAGMRSSRVTIIGSTQMTGPWGLEGKYSLYGRGINDNNKALLLPDVDAAITCGGTCRQFGHIVKKTVSDASTDIAISDWRTYIDGVAERVRDGRIDVVTMSRWAMWAGI